MDQDVKKPRLATNLPAPRPVAREEMARAMAEAREFRASLERATAGMETLQGSDERIRLK